MATNKQYITLRHFYGNRIDKLIPKTYKLVKWPVSMISPAIQSNILLAAGGDAYQLDAEELERLNSEGKIFSSTEKYDKKLLLEVEVAINELIQEEYNHNYQRILYKIVDVIYPTQLEYFTKYIHAVEYYSGPLADIVGTSGTVKHTFGSSLIFYPILVLRSEIVNVNKKLPLDVGKSLFGSIPKINKLAGQPIEIDTEYERGLLYKLKDWYNHASDKNANAIIKYYTALQKLKNKFPKILIPPGKYVYRGVNTTDFVKANKNGIMSVLQSGKFDFIYAPDRLYSDMYIAIYANIKPVHAVTSWSTDIRTAYNFGGTFFVSEITDDYVMHPKVSDAIGTYSESEVLYLTPGKKSTETLLLIKVDDHKNKFDIGWGVLDITHILKPLIKNGDYIDISGSSTDIIQKYLKLK